MRALMWFRADLRVSDNRALSAACRDATRGVIAVFLLTPTQWREHDWGAIRVNFLLRNLAALERKLAGLNIPLRVIPNERFSDAAESLRQIARTFECDALYFNREYELNERRRDDAVATALSAAGLSVHACDDQTVLAPGRVLTGQDGWYTVFTPFKKRWLATLSADDVRLAALPARQPEAPCAASPIPGTLPAFGDHDRPDLWEAGEDAAQQRLASFAAGRSARLPAYAEQRDFPALNGTSTLSPYLAVGALSPRQCLAAAIERNDGRTHDGQRGCDVWITELIWREFYKHILVGFPRVCMGRAFRAETEDLPWNPDEAAFQAWCDGRTGFPIVDAAMRQLTRTGWMHNRLRMIVAMFLTKDLFIDWRRGEQFFMQHLIDGDLAANNGGWQWSASTGTDAAPYFRVFNPISQSAKFDPDGAFIRKFLPELAALDNAAIHEPYARPDLRTARLDYPRPIVDRAQTRARVMAAFGALKGK